MGVNFGEVMRGFRDFKSGLMTWYLWCCLNVVVIMFIYCGKGKNAYILGNFEEKFIMGKGSHIVSKSFC
jgi:hypothetical protein